MGKRPIDADKAGRNGRQVTMQPEHVDIDRSYFIAQRALELMKTYGSSADPRSYEVWYTYVSGHIPGMNEEIKRITAEQGSLNDSDIDGLFDQHLAMRRTARDTEKLWAQVEFIW